LGGANRRRIGKGRALKGESKRTGARKGRARGKRGPRTRREDRPRSKNPKVGTKRIWVGQSSAVGRKKVAMIEKRPKRQSWPGEGADRARKREPGSETSGMERKRFGRTKEE